MRTRVEPVHISEPLVSVWLDLEAAFWARREGQSMPVENEDDEVAEEPAPCRRRGRDPPTGALRVNGMFGSQHEDDERGNE